MKNGAAFGPLYSLRGLGTLGVPQTYVGRNGSDKTRGGRLRMVRRGSSWTEHGYANAARTRPDVGRSEGATCHDPRRLQRLSSNGWESATSATSYQISQNRVQYLKIRNFRVRAPFSTFFISTRRWERTLQLSFRLRQLILTRF